MKKYIRTIIIVTVVSLSLVLIAGCNNKKEETSAPVATTQAEPENNEDKNEGKNEAESPTSEQTPVPIPEEESLMVELGNDMGHNLSALWIRASAEDEWTEIVLENNVWETGYLIPVKLEAESIPKPKNGWQVKIEFADDSTTHIFEDVLLNTEASVILTQDGPIY